jgi:hypothetical protein
MQGHAMTMCYVAKHVFRNNRCVCHGASSSEEGFVEGSQSSKDTPEKNLPPKSREVVINLDLISQVQNMLPF